MPQHPNETRLEWLVDAPVALRDDPPRLCLRGLPPGGAVDVAATAVDANGRTWRSAARFAADAEGGVDLARAAPLAGGHAGADPWGLVWSLTPDPVEGPDPWPTFARSPVGEWRLDLVARAGDGSEARAELVRRGAAPGVTREEVADAGLPGVLYRPPGPGPFPAMLVLGGSEGGLSMEEVAALFASRGFVALHVAYFRAEGLPGELVEIPAEGFAAARAWLAARPGVDGARIGVYGVSKGGEAALVLASAVPGFAAVAAIVPSGVVFEGIGRLGASGKSSWTVGGVPLPFLPAYGGVDWNALYSAGPVRLRPIHEAALALDGAAARAATLPLEGALAPVLLASGGDDGLWPPELAHIAERRLRAGGRDVTHLHYPLAGHGLMPPGVPTFKSAPMAHASGGTAATDAAARADLWPRLLAFLDRTLRRPASPTAAPTEAW